MYIKHEMYIQTGVLEELATLNPNARQWIKGDGTDVVKGLWQSVTDDVDLDDGGLQELYKEYWQRNNAFEAVGLLGKSVEEIKSKLISVKDMIQGQVCIEP